MALAVHRRGGVVLHLLDGREPAAHGSEGVQPTLLMGNVSCRLSGASVAAAAAHHLNATLERWWRTELRAEGHHFCPFEVACRLLMPRPLSTPPPLLSLPKLPLCSLSCVPPYALPTACTHADRTPVRVCVPYTRNSRTTPSCQASFSYFVSASFLVTSSLRVSILLRLATPASFSYFVSSSSCV